MSLIFSLNNSDTTGEIYVHCLFSWTFRLLAIFCFISPVWFRTEKTLLYWFNISTESQKLSLWIKKISFLSISPFHLFSSFVSCSSYFNLVLCKSEICLYHYMSSHVWSFNITWHCLLQLLRQHHSQYHHPSNHLIVCAACMSKKTKWNNLKRQFAQSQL